MPTTTVRYHLTCTAEDPQAPARVMGVFAARSVLPLTYLCERVAEILRIDIRLALEEGDSLDAYHLARLLSRIVTVETVRMNVDGKSVAFELECP